jgi:5'-nucleotidase/UDP-sugar diphosphatase
MKRNIGLFMGLLWSSIGISVMAIGCADETVGSDSLLFGQRGPQLERPDGFRFTVLHTNDLHSQFLGRGPDALYTDLRDGDPVIGGYARLATQIRTLRAQKEAENEPVLLLDGGDFFAGSLFHVVGPSLKSARAPELEFFSAVGYDAIVPGNHEFDAGEAGFLNMLEKAERLGLTVPFVLSNEKRSAESPLERWYVDSPKSEGVGISDVMARDLSWNGSALRVCLFGALGPSAAFASVFDRQQTKFFGFNDKRAKEDIDELVDHLNAKVNDAWKTIGCNFNILVTHAGSPEDATLAKRVRGLDLIVSGHTHEKYLRSYGDTIVAQTGFHGGWLGKLEIEIRQGKATLRSLNDTSSDSNDSFLPVDDRVPSDPVVMALVQDAKAEISNVLGSDRRFDDPIVTITEEQRWTDEYPNNPLGAELLGRVKSQVDRCLKEQGDNRKTDLYVSVMSLIRSEFSLGGRSEVTYQYSDLFKFFSIGFSSDMRAGSEVVTLYLTKDEVKRLVEFFEVYRHINQLALPAFSGNFSYETRALGVPLVNRVHRMRWEGLNWEQAPDLMRVATNTIIVRYLDQITRLSRGLVSLRPRQGSGELGRPAPIPCDLREHDLLIRSYE